jgi:hypothetical protein
MNYKLFIDDERLPSHVKWVTLPRGPWVVVRNYDHFVKYITQHGLPSFVSFDHDLGLEHYAQGFAGTAPTYENYKEKTGYECAKWLVEHCIQHNYDFPEYQVHSMNPIGGKNIRSYIESYKKSRK